MKNKIKGIIQKVVEQDAPAFSVEIPDDKSHGDYSSNIALVLSKKLGENPKEVAEEIKNKIGENKLFSKIEIAGPGFINFFIADKVFTDNLKNISREEKNSPPNI